LREEKKKEGKQAGIRESISQAKITKINKKDAHQRNEKGRKDVRRTSGAAGPLMAQKKNPSDSKSTAEPRHTETVRAFLWWLKKRFITLPRLWTRPRLSSCSTDKAFFGWLTSERVSKDDHGNDSAKRGG
jgi:hypothetical protein